MTHVAIWGAATVIVKIPAAVADRVHQPRNLEDQPSLFDPDPALNNPFLHDASCSWKIGLPGPVSSSR